MMGDNVLLGGLRVRTLQVVEMPSTVGTGVFE